MEQLRRSAAISIGRATAFAAFGIFCLMIGLSFDPALMVRTGGVLSLGLAVGLILKAELALRQDHRRTEMWLLLPPDDRPPHEIAQRVSGTVLRETYLRFAMMSAGASAILSSLTVVFWLAGI
jgi:hypothetical protein